MADIVLAAVTVYAWSMSLADADVVNHGCLLQKLSVKVQVGMGVGNGQRLAHHLLTMNDEDVPQGIILAVVFVDDLLIVHVMCGYGQMPVDGYPASGRSM